MAPLAFALAAAPRFAYHLPPETWRKAVEYAHTRYWLHFLAIGWALLVLVLLIRWRLGPWLRDRAEAATPRRWLQALLVAPPLLALPVVAELPFYIYRHHLALQYGQSIHPWPAWFADWTKSQLLSLAAGTFLVWLLYAVIRRSPRRWWLWFWLASLPLMASTVFLLPLVVDPLFHRYRPLAERHGDLVQRLELVTARAGAQIPRERMLEMLASQKTRQLNAYVTGFGPSKRLVIFDTLLAAEGPDQVLSTFGHELGHYQLGHIGRTMALGALYGLLLAWAGARLLGRIGGRWGIRDLGDWASLPVILLALSVAMFLTEPVENAYSRWQENAADEYSLWVTTGILADPGRAGAESFQVEGELNLSDPAPPAFIRFWLYSHPPVADRIRLCAEYLPPGR